MTEPNTSFSTTIFGAVVGTTGTTSPFWMTWVDSADRIGVAIGGLVIITLTGLKVWTELQIRRRQLADLDHKP